jgi:hypothetical protein
LIREGGTYFKSHYGSVGSWFVVLLATATAAAWLTGNALGKRKAAGGQRRSFESGWSRAFREGAKGWIRIGCDLIDGTYVEGWLLSLNTDLEETDDRALVLSGPQLWIRRDTELVLWDIGTVVIGAGQLRLTSFRYYDANELPVLAGPGGSPASAVP